jgi:L-threonylcarbamoyladenylate synthase
MNTSEAAQKLLEGHLVVFPTETVYGLGALANNEEAVRNIFEVKGRPSHNPLILHIAANNQLMELVEEVSPQAQRLIDHFWPGPLTICLKKSEQVSDLVSGGLPTVCVRRPDHPMAQDLLRIVGKALAAPSANLSGKPSTTSFEDAKKQLEQKGVHFLDGGKSPLGLESTVVDCSTDTVRLLRPGVISKSEIEIVLEQGIEDSSCDTSGKISSPGQLLEHYAPQGQLIVLYGHSAQRKAWMNQQPDLSEYVLGTFPDAENSFPGKKYILAKSEADLPAYASELYAFLNWCDREKAQKILLELPFSPHPFLPALLNRLEKASKGHIVSL